MSYVNGNYKRSTSLSRWADIYLAAYNLVQGCLNFHSQGGAATVTSKSSTTHLKFFWNHFQTQTPRRRYRGRTSTYHVPLAEWRQLRYHDEQVHELGISRRHRS